MFGRPSAKYRSSDRTCVRYTECIYVVRNVSDVTTNGGILALFDMSCSDVNPNVGLPYIAIVFAFFLWDIAATQDHCRPKDCFDLRCYRQSNGKDGPHTIYPDTYLPSLNVSCDQETLDGGWIMYQRRVDGTLNFTRYWDEYKNGFGNNGDNTTELWLGNEKVYQLLQSFGNKVVTLRIEAEAFDGKRCSIESYNFTMSNEAALYSIDWDSSRVYGPNQVMNLMIARAWNNHKNHAFRTLDKPKDRFNLRRCVQLYKGGWWYVGTCIYVFLNGEYINHPIQTKSSIYIMVFDANQSLKRSRMMFRPKTKALHVCNNPCRNGATCEHVPDPRGHRCVCKSAFCGPECEWNNTCKNGGSCENVTDPTGHRCVCNSAFCGQECELENTCKNGGTCEYNETTNNTTCKCSVEFSGPKCEDEIPETPTISSEVERSETPTISNIVIVGGILLLLVLIGLGVTAFVIYKRHQKQSKAEEAAARKRTLAEHMKRTSYQDYMIDLFGF